MSLLHKPRSKDEIGRIHALSPKDAGWHYVGFDVYRVPAGETIEIADTGDQEQLLVLIEGKGHAEAGGQDLGLVGSRMTLWAREKPWCIYVPNQSSWRMTATTDLELAVCKAPGKGGHPVRLIKPNDIQAVKRGTGTNTRYINPIMMEEADWADSLLVTEVWTPAGHWSSHPAHKHDQDDFPNETLLEETYYHRINPPQGWGIQRVYTDDLSLNETMAVYDRDLVCVPRGYHPCGALYGFDMYYLNVMAGPLRKWRFNNDPNCDWIAARDAAMPMG